ncbi:hypothetical protein SP15_025 [Bacillus phage SP-15]|uniref:Uncharacterized protein n=1 Tax=Bacillus phage SP-15 TaxID=1792032 RepID=A0A127AX37_9CAUD|nr:hypothetical protein SP15_025 [Bacillus phage SP-15]AMM44824.1 hypothetical protein SP15_025 [Bacillus phage SP-15]
MPITFLRENEEVIMQEDKWVTVTKGSSPLKGRHLLLDDKGNIKGGNVPKHVQDKMKGGKVSKGGSSKKDYKDMSDDEKKSMGDSRRKHFRDGIDKEAKKALSTPATDDKVYSGKKTIKRYTVPEENFGLGHSGLGSERYAKAIADVKMAAKDLTTKMQKKYPGAKVEFEANARSTGIGAGGVMYKNPTFKVKGVPHEDPLHNNALKILAAHLSKADNNSNAIGKSLGVHW